MWKYATLVLMAALLLSCDPGTRTDDYGHIQDHAFKLVKVAYNQLYQNRPTLYNTMYANPVDEDGVSLFAWEGELYYHPVQIGQRCQQALSDYNNSSDPRYLNYVRASVSALDERATRYEDKIIFPYMFDFSPGHTTLTYHAPWHSGMAQGVLLSVFSRMYHLTGEARYKELADSTFASLADIDSDKACVYVTQADTLGVPDNYYWVDEYPCSDQRYVLNGSIIGSFGLYDYWWVFGNTLAGRLFSMQLSTVRDNALLYRNPGAISSYCLKFRYQDPNYHALHQVLLNQYFLYSGDPYFQALSGLFYADYH